MQRLKRFQSDRGAVAVWVAILLVPLMVVAALAIDVGAMHADRQRLQHGADAAALAIAQQCAAGACGSPTVTAQELVNANEPQGGPAAAEVLELDTSAGWVEVAASGERDLWFAPVIGVNDAAQTRVGAASWGNPARGRSAIPLTFSTCTLGQASQPGDAGHPRPQLISVDATGRIVGLAPGALGATVRLYQSKAEDDSCRTNNGLNVPGGFGWLPPEPNSDCTILTAIGTPAASGNGAAPGNSSPCWTTMRTAIDNRTVALLPVFSTASKFDKTYMIAGYIAVTLNKYRFQGNSCYPATACSIAVQGNEGWIEVTVDRYIDLSSDFETGAGAPNLGGQVVELRLPSEG